jgi:hypothetical protein
MQQRLKDRDEELRGKAKLLDVCCHYLQYCRCMLRIISRSYTHFAPSSLQDVQDELASLNLQFNMAEERAGRFQRENQELIDRWMAHKGKEADAMNEASKFS